MKCAKASGGKRLGTSGTKIGNVHWRWAFAAAAVLFVRPHQPGKADLPNLAHKHGKAPALPVRAPKLARAVYDLLARHQTFDRKRCVPA